MKKKLFFLTIGLFILSACGPTEGDVTETPIPTETNTPVPSATLKPGETPPTPTETPIPSDTPEPSDTPTPFHDLSGVSILSYGNAGAGQYFINFTGIEGLDITGLFFLANNEVYSCSIPQDYPDRFYCTGPAFEPGTIVKVQVVLLGDVVIWEGEFMVPYPQPTATSEARDDGSDGGTGGEDDGDLGEGPPTTDD